MFINKQLGIGIIFMLFCSGVLQAKPIDLEKAKKVALSHLQLEKRFKSSNAIHLQSVRAHTTQTLRSDSPDSPYYVFNIGDNQGFIIISGDDVALPVLAYSDKGRYDESHLPPNFAYWMNGLESEIIAAQNQSLQADEETQTQWNNYLNGTVLRSGTWPQFLVQTQWDQLEPYNLLCPEYGSGKTVTGCVATAMAQIMKFYNYPVRANPMAAYTTGYSSIDIPAIESPEDYDWNNMRFIYNGSSTPQENDAVAALMYHCGVASHMDYDVLPYGSATTSREALNAFRTIFDYDTNVQLLSREYYSDNDWKALLIKEIVEEQRPVLYAGMDNRDNGHAFVCDGYQSGNYFHFNWGWGGDYDGWFLLDVLNPGRGSATYGYGVFTEEQQAITHIQPNTGEPLNPELKLGANLISPATVVRNQTWTISIPIYNFNVYAFNGKIGAFLMNGADQIADTVGIKSFSINALTYKNAESISCQLRPSTKAGNYQLQICSKATDATEWKKVCSISYDGYTDEVNTTVLTNDPPTTRWNGTNSDWNHSANWSHGLPGVDSDVTIAVASAYPNLTETVYVNDIYFEAGTEIGRQDFLSYHRAHVKIDFGIGGLARNQWHLMSIPLQQVYTGDFCFGGHPYTFLRQNELTAVDGQLPAINWKDIRSHSKMLVPGEGFALWVNSGSEGTKGRSDLSSDELSGLGFVNGVMELPYFENTVQNASHRIQQYENEQSRFYAFDTKEEGFPIDHTATSVTRNINAYHLANKEVTVNVSFGEYDGKHIALVGNPFLTTIDLEKFYEDNAGVIRPVFLIWQYPDWIVNENFDIKYLKPMQAFYVEQEETAGDTATIIFRVANISAVGQ